ncbi:MAG: hypothetical protein ACRDMH_15850 [Solirubrobacterales bacterium]
MGCELRIEVVGDEDRGREILDLITDETGIGHEPANGGGRFAFLAADCAEVREGLSGLLDRRTDDWRDHLSF